MVEGVLMGKKAHEKRREKYQEREWQKRARNVDISILLRLFLLNGLTQFFPDLLYLLSGLDRLKRFFPDLNHLICLLGRLD